MSAHDSGVMAAYPRKPQRYEMQPSSLVADAGLAPDDLGGWVKWEDVEHLFGVKERRPLGCALAMRVMQSDLYKQLDDVERADCDELVQRNLEWFKRDSADGVVEDGRG